jgi:hypothetical protein
VLVPQRGVSRNVKGEATALVVGAGNTVEQRVLNVGRPVGDSWLVNAGLAAGDKVIVEGSQKARPNAVVTPVAIDARSPPARPRRPAAAGSLIMARFFIDRPIFAWVIAIVIMLAGALSIGRLPWSNTPTSRRPDHHLGQLHRRLGRDHRELGGAGHRAADEGPRPPAYMSSSSSSAGSAQITLTFEAGTNPTWPRCRCRTSSSRPIAPAPDRAEPGRVGGQDRHRLPDDRVAGVRQPRTTAIDIGDYISTSLLDPVSRVEGVGDVQALGTGYAMRIWLDPAKLQKYSLMPGDVKSAIQAQKGAAQVSAGQLGGLPRGGQQINATITARSKLQTPEQFGAIVLKTGTDGAVVHLSTWPASSWAARATTSACSTTASLGRPSASSWPPAPTRCHRRG